MTEQELTKLKRRRGVSKASITRIYNRIDELEGLGTRPYTIDTAKQLASKLEALDSEFKSYHFQIVDLLEEDEALEKREQQTLDNHDDQVAEMTLRLQKLYSLKTPRSSTDICDQHRLLTRKFEHLHGCINARKAQIADLDKESESSHIEQLQIQLLDYESTLKILYSELLAVEDQGSVGDELTQHSKLEDTLFECFSKIRKLLKSGSSSTTSRVSGVRLPKIEVPTFEGDILQWKQFWEQFCVSVHDRDTLADAEKMVYLRHALKNGSAKAIVEGLAQSGSSMPRRSNV